MLPSSSVLMLCLPLNMLRACCPCACTAFLATSSPTCTLILRACFDAGLHPLSLPADSSHLDRLLVVLRALSAVNSFKMNPSIINQIFLLASFCIMPATRTPIYGSGPHSPHTHTSTPNVHGASRPGRSTQTDPSTSTTRSAVVRCWACCSRSGYWRR